MSREILDDHDKKDITTDCGGISESEQPGSGKQKRIRLYVEPASYFPKDFDEKYFEPKDKKHPPIIDFDKAEKSFIEDVANKCIKKLSDEDKKYMREHTDSSEYHFSYGLYIRNHYIHNKNLFEKGIRAMPDELSDHIVARIIEKLEKGEG